MRHRPPALAASALLPFIGVPVVDALTPLPSWLVIVLFTGTTAVTVAGIVFPQDSKDRLAWWQSWWNRPRRRGDRPADPDQ